jgi:hypothetical protein
LESRYVVSCFIGIVKPRARLAFAILFILQIAILPCPVSAWSIDTHSKIAKAATELLPSPWRQFFTYYAWLLSETATYPDTYYRENDPNESPRHFIDMEIWNPNDPSTGTLPQAVEEFTREMESAIQAKDWNSMFLDAGRLSHYMADVTQPYHTTVNYNPLTKNGVGVHQLFESASDAHLSDIRMVSSADVGPIEPVSNVTAFILETAIQSHSFLPYINRTLIDEGQDWSRELTRILENRTNAAIVASARIWYTAIVRSNSLPPEIPKINELSIVVENISLNSTNYGVIKLHVIDALGVKTPANVSLSVDGSTFRGQVANTVPPIGEYVIAVPSGTYNANFVLTAQNEGYKPATMTLGLVTSAPSNPTPVISIPLPTIVGLIMMTAAVLVLIWYRRRTGRQPWHWIVSAQTELVLSPVRDPR